MAIQSDSYAGQKRNVVESFPTILNPDGNGKGRYSQKSLLVAHQGGRGAIVTHSIYLPLPTTTNQKGSDGVVNKETSRLVAAVNSPDAIKAAERARNSVYAGYMLVNVGVLYDLPEWVRGVKLGKPTRPDTQGHYKIPVVLANGNGTPEDYTAKGITVRPETATQIMIIPYAGTRYGYRLLYLAPSPTTR